MKTVVFEGIYATREKQARKYDHQEDSDLDIVEVVYVKLDGKIHRFEEDPSDGYRSYCVSTLVAHAPKKAKFNFEYSPVLVNMVNIKGEVDESLGLNGESWEYVSRFDGIVLISPRDNTTILGQFGTDNSDDYYPSCRMYMDIVEINKHCIPNTEAGMLIYGKEDN